MDISYLMIITATPSFEAKYNVRPFLRPSKQFQAKQFSVHTIKHSFQNAGIWSVSFKAINVKLEEYQRAGRRWVLEFIECRVRVHVALLEYVKLQRLI